MSTRGAARSGDDEADLALTFSPWPLRRKKGPKRSDVRAWLNANGGIVRKVALALRADPRPEEFAVLGDALTDAGCGNADLLASCRRDAHDEDRAWVLTVLIG